MRKKVIVGIFLGLALHNILGDAANLFNSGNTMDALHHLVMGYWSPVQNATNAVIFLNIFGALLLGLMVGYERSYRGRAAGMRTYGLVCMSSCALTVIGGYPEYWFAGQLHVPNGDPGRIIQGIVTGIGFLGAGVIMRDGLNISGLTTAASIWSVAAIGVLVGVGFYGAAILLAVLSTLFMVWGGKIEGVLPSRHAVAVNLHFYKGFVPQETELHHMIETQGYEIARGSFSIAAREDRQEWRFVAVSLGDKKVSTLVNLSGALARAKGIESFHLTHARN